MAFGFVERHCRFSEGRHNMTKAHFQIFVAGHSPRSDRAIANLRRLCTEKLKGDYELEIIDVIQRPDLAEAEKILASPTLIKLLPLPRRRLVGDLSNVELVCEVLELTAPT